MIQEQESKFPSSEPQQNFLINKGQWTVCSKIMTTSIHQMKSGGICIKYYLDKPKFGLPMGKWTDRHSGAQSQ